MNLQPFFSSFWLTCAVSLLSAQPAWAQVTQVTGVRIEARDSGLEVILATPEGASPQVLRTTSSKTVAFDILNAQLRLPDGKDFRANNPAAGIESITVTQPNANSVRVTVIGTSVPVAKVVPSRTGLVFNLSVPADTAETSEPATEPEEQTEPATTPQDEAVTPEVPEEEEAEIIVTGEREEESYQVPNASTGTRTDTPIRDIPQAIQVVPQQVLEDQRVIRVGEALRNVSGITPSDISTRGSAIGATIRGFETDNILRNGLRDDTTRRISETTNIEQIEILKGPASVLFGQGNLGGTINIITKQPLAEPFYSAEFTAGSFSLYRPSLDLTGPLDINRSLLYRLNASYESSDSFIDFDHSDRAFIAPVLRWNIGENTTLTVEAEHVHEWTDGFAPQLPASGTVEENPNGDIPISANLGEPSLTESDRRVTRIGYRFEHRFNDDWLIRNDFAAAFGRTPENTGVQIQGLRNDRTALRILVENPSEEDILSLNTNLVGNFTTGDIDHKFLLGLELAREDIKDRINYGFPDPIDIFNPIYNPEEVTLPSPQQDTRTLTESIGIYIQDQIYFSDNLILVLGGRFDIADQTFEETVQAPPTDFSRKDEVFNPRLGIVYKPIEPVSIYASYSRSFNPLSGLTADRVPLEPESGTQYEVGVKTDFFDERLSATLAFYNLERTNVAVEDFDNPGFQLQVGEQRSRGIELDVTGEILPGWNIIASYAYTTTEITEDDERPNLVGNQLNNIPEHAASLWTTYELQGGVLQGLGFGLGVYFVGEREGDLENNFRLPQYWRTDAALYYRRNNFRAQLNFQNLFDIRYFESARNVFRVNPGAPFTVLGTIGWEF